MDTLQITPPPILDLPGRAWFDVQLMHFDDRFAPGAFR
jgi:hypothetical protein